MAYTRSISPVTGDTSAAATNTSRIQAFIDAGGGDLVAAGDIYINDTLTLGDGAKLRTAPGCRLRQVVGTNKKMVATKQLAAASTTVTVTWTAGRFASVAWTAHGLDLGDWVVLQGANEADWWDIFNVVSVTDANTVVVALPFTVTAAPTGTITAKRCNRFIDVDIDVFYDYTGGNNAAAGMDRMATVFAFFADSEVKVRGRDAMKYIVQLSGCANIAADIEGYPFSRSDTVKLYGPARNPRIKVNGSSAEDVASMQALEPAAYIAYMPSRGTIRGAKILDASATVTTAGSGPLVIYSDDRHLQENIEIIGGEFRTGPGNIPAFYIRPGDNFGASASRIRDVTIRGTRLQAGGNTHVIRIAAYVRSMLIDGAKITPPGVDDRYPIAVTDNAVVDELIIENFVFDGGLWPVSIPGYLVTVEPGSTIKNLVLRNCSFRGSSSLRCIFQQSGSGIGVITLENCEGDNMNGLIRVDATPTLAPLVVVRGGRFNNVLSIVNARTSLKAIIEDAYFNGASNGVIRAEISGTVVDFHERGCTFAGSSVPFVCLTSATINPKAPFLSMDIGATGVNKTVGNACIASALQGTIPANTPVLADGTNWRSILNPSLLF